jgi:hypothetical protein
MSSPTGGNFDCARLQEIKVPLAALVDPNDVKNAEYIPDIAPLKMVQEISTARFPDLEDPTKNNSYKAIWMDDCDDTQPTDCTESCEISGSSIGTVCKNYELDVCFEKSYTVSEMKFRELGSSVNMDQEIAIGLAKKLKLMDEEWARRTVSALDSMSGTNLNTSPYTVSSDSTAIPATAWNPDLFGYFAVTKNRNKLPNMKLLLGGLMEQTLWSVSMQGTDPTGASAARKIGSLGTVYSDSFLTEDVLEHKAAFLVAPSALAVVTKAYFKPYGAGREEVASGNKQIMYTITSPNSGIVYDVTYQVKCITSGGIKDWEHTWQLKSKGAVLTSPVFCNTSRTGVLQFVCA